MKTKLEKFIEFFDFIAEIFFITMIVYSAVNDEYVQAIFYLLLTMAWEKKYD